VLDPAVGSGAFLLDALRLLCRIRLSLEREPDAYASLRLRKEILRENLFGIDINPFAVRLAELRLWLSVVADDPTTDIHAVSPLPNLDGVVRQGNTLLDPLGAARTFNPQSPLHTHKVASAIQSTRQALFDARGREHKRSIQRLRNEESALAEQLLGSAVEGASRATEDLSAVENGKDLFGNKARLSQSQRSRLNTLNELRNALESARRKLTEGEIPFFSFEVHTPDVVSEGGFNVVIGNPPWVRAEQLSPQLRLELKSRFQWWKSERQVGYSHLPDLSVAFLERCLELTRNGGAVGLLVPSKLASAGYGESARRGVVRETMIAYVHRVPAREAARFGATTYPLAIVVRKGAAPSDHHVTLGFDGRASLPQRSLDRPGPWVLAPSKVCEALDEFRNSGAPLGAVAKPMLGVKTGVDRCFVGKLIRRDEPVSLVSLEGKEVQIETSLLRPALRGRDVRNFEVNPNEVIVWCYDEQGSPLRDLPKYAARYFEACSSVLRARSDFRAGPTWAVFRTRCVFSNNRVVWPDIARAARAAVLEATQSASAIPLNSCYVTGAREIETSLAIAAVLNSSWATAFFYAFADEASNGYRRINARAARLLPVPSKKRIRNQLAEIAQRAHRHEEFSIDRLDETVAQALGLSTRTENTLRAMVSDIGG